MKYIILAIVFFTAISFNAFADTVNNGKCFFRPLEFQKLKDNIKLNENGYDKNYCRYGEVFIKFPKDRMINPNDSYNNSKRWVSAKTEISKILDSKFKRFIALDEFNYYVRSYQSCLYQRKKQQKLRCIVLKSDGKTCINKYKPPFYGCATSPKSILYDKE